METIHEGLQNKEFPSYIGKQDEEDYDNDDHSRPVETEEAEETDTPVDIIEEPTNSSQETPTKKPQESIPTDPPIIEPTELPIQPDPPEEEPDLPEEPQEPENPEEESVG